MRHFYGLESRMSIIDEIPPVPKEKIYHFTAAELKAHDVQVARQARENAEALIIKNMRTEMKKEYEEQKAHFEEETQKFWAKCREEFKSGDEAENFFAWCRVMWSIPIAVLVEKFHWQPISEDSCCDNRQALVKFCNACVEMADNLRKNENKDVRTLCREIGEKYGASFVINEDCDEPDGV